MDDYLCSGVDTPDSVGRREPFPGSEYPSSLPACATVRLVLSAGPSGASDWVGFQDPGVSVGEIFDLCNDHDPGRARVNTVWIAESFMQILRVQRSAVYRWICCSKMSGVPPVPFFSVCRLRSDYVCCSGVINLPQSDCVIQLLPLHKQLDSYPYDLMTEFVVIGALP